MSQKMHDNKRIKKAVSFRLKAAAAVVLSTVLLSGVHAAGLGKMTVLSALGQPLEAEIELHAASMEEAQALRVKLASADTFRAANVEYKQVLNALRFAVREKNGQPVIAVTSSQPVNELFLDMLLEVEGNGGRLVREYSFMLDPVEMRKPQPVQVGAVKAPVPIIPRDSSPIPTLSSQEKQGLQQAPALPAPAVPASATTEQGVPAAKAGSRNTVERQEQRESGSSRNTKTPPPSPDVVAAKVPESNNGGQPVSAEYEVEKGDTLHKIARQTKPDGVSLDQMLVALHRANPKAFAGNNMNRLRTGQILSIPEAAEAKAVPSAEASRIVVAQAADFNQYKEKLAHQVAAGDAQVATESRQSAAGKISARVEERDAKAAQSKDKLELSKSGIPATGAASGGVIPAGAEERLAAEKALAEANSRVAELEKNISSLQKILEIKNQELAAKQAQLDAVKTAGTTAADSTPAPSLAAAAAAPAATVVAAPGDDAAAKNISPETKPSSEQPAAPAQPEAAQASAATVDQLASAPVQPPAPAPVPQPAPPQSKPAVTPALAPEPESLLDHILEHPLRVPLAGVLAALGIVGIIASRRRRKRQSMAADASLQANTLFGSTGGQSIDTNNSVFNSNFTPSASQLDTNEVDPIAEAELYIGYQKDDQAEEILKEALRTQPTRTAVRVKLLEIYARRNDKVSFELIARELHGLTKGNGQAWQQAANMGAKIDPDNLLYAAGAAHVKAGIQNVKQKQESADELDLGTLLNSTQMSPKPAAKLGATAPSGDALAAMAAGTAVTAQRETVRTAEIIKEQTPGTAYQQPEAAALDFPAMHFPQGNSGNEDGLPASIHGSSSFDSDLHHSSATSSAAASTDSGSHDLDFDLSGISLDLTSGEVSDSGKAGAGQEANTLAGLDFDQMLQSAAHPAGSGFGPSFSNSGKVSGAIPDLPRDSGMDMLADFSFPQTAPAASDMLPGIGPDTLSALDFSQSINAADDFSLNNIPEIQEALELPAATPQAAESSLADFDWLQTAAAETPALPPPAEEVSLPLHKPGPVAAAAMPATPISTEAELTTKLDLAIAYKEIGDKEGARELLEEVVASGHSGFAEKAKILLQKVA